MGDLREAASSVTAFPLADLDYGIAERVEGAIVASWISAAIL